MVCMAAAFPAYLNDTLTLPESGTRCGLGGSPSWGGFSLLLLPFLAGFSI